MNIWFETAIAMLGILANPMATPVASFGQEVQPPASARQVQSAPAAKQPETDQATQPENPQAAPSTESKPALPCTSTASGSGSSPCAADTPGVTRRKKHKAANPATSTSGDGPPRTVVRNGGTVEPAMDLAPGVSQQQVSQQGQKASDLLTATDANLKKISTRQLDAAEQETVGQIKSYVEQAKAAANDGDVQRAYNLALKAKLLSADLAGK